jgi:prepilin-type processing-associated H-X9-DG protein
MTCTNHIKQVLVGLHNYHDTYNSFPKGCKFGVANSTDQLGCYNFRISILPFVEQQSAYSGLNFNYRFSGRHTTSSNNQPILQELVVPVYHCPSNELPPINNDSTNRLNGLHMLIDYCGISGAYSDPLGRTIKNSNNGGYVSLNGFLILNEWRGIESGTDGTSNTLLIGEQSRKLPTNAAGNLDVVSSNANGGWFGGILQHPSGTAFPPDTKLSDSSIPTTAIAETYTTGLTTVRYPINSKLFTNSVNFGAGNTRLGSSHSNGANSGLADGSVRFLSETIDFTSVLARICTYDDGEPVAGF